MEEIEILKGILNSYQYFIVFVDNVKLLKRIIFKNNNNIFVIIIVFYVYLEHHQSLYLYYFQSLLYFLENEHNIFYHK